jgi:nucleotide-binding universal stress UspA family protein
MTTLSSLPYKKVVVPLDGSALAESVLAHLPTLLAPDTTELILVNVVEAWRYSLGAGDFAATNLAEFVRSGAEAYLASQCERLQQLGYRVTTHVMDLDPAQAILDVAKANQADLIAMTTHGRSGFVRWALGSVAERVLQETPAPVLLVRATTSLPAGNIQQILVPLDGSTLAEAALPVAKVLAQQTGATLRLVQAIQPIATDDQQVIFASGTDVQSMFEEWHTSATQYLHSLELEVNAKGIPCTTQVTFGDPDKVICSTVDDEGIDLIVMSTHGRSGLKRWVYGSVANKVLHSANCPLLLLRSREGPQ